MSRDTSLWLMIGTGALLSVAACSHQEAPPPAAPVAVAAPAKPAFVEVQGALAPVVLGVFDPGNPVATAMTGRLTITDGKLTGENGASFTTERVAIAKGSDLFAGGYSYASAMDIPAEQPVEIRKVVAQTPPTNTPGNTFCGDVPVGFLALVRDMQGGETVKLVALKGQMVPGPNSSDTSLCALTMYFPPLKS